MNENNLTNQKSQRDIIYEILQSLPQDRNPIRFKDIRKKVKMSSSTLAKGLSCLKKMGIIDKKQVPSVRATGIEYSISPDFGIDLYKEDNCKDIDQIICITDRLILELFDHYDKAEENQKEVIFDDHLSIIIKFLKLCRILRKRSKIKNDKKNCV